MKIKTIIIASLFLLVAPLCFGATSGTVSVQTEKRGSMSRYKIEWTSDDLGNVVDSSVNVQGYLKRVSFQPSSFSTTDTSGTVTSFAPTDNYDVVIDDDINYDILGGTGSNLDEVASSLFIPLIIDPITPTSSNFYPVFGNLNIKITNAGANKKGWIAVYFDNFQ